MQIVSTYINLVVGPGFIPVFDNLYVSLIAGQYGGTKYVTESVLSGMGLVILVPFALYIGQNSFPGTEWIYTPVLLAELRTSPAELGGAVFVLVPRPVR